MDGWMDGWMNGWMGGWMDEWMDGLIPRNIDQQTGRYVRCDRYKIDTRQMGNRYKIDINNHNMLVTSTNTCLERQIH